MLAPAPSDFADARWWAGMPAEEEAYGTNYALREISEQAFKFTNCNHPNTDPVGCVI